MRNKLILIVLGIVFSLNTFGQSSVLIHEDFEGVISGWTATSTAPTWSVNDYTAFNSANFSVPLPRVAAETNVAAISNTGGIGKMLISPSFNAVGYDSVEIWFDYYFQNGTNNAFEFGYSDDGGATITDYFDLTGATNPPWSRVYLTLYPADLTSNMLFYFYFQGMTVGGLAIDNVNVIGYKSVSNKSCANATVLTPGATCVPTAAVIELNSNSGGSSACYPTRTPNGDTWFQFTATTAIHKISAGGVDLSDMDLVMEVYSGSCGNLTLLACVDEDDVSLATSDGIENYVAGDFVPGQTYYVRLYNYYPSNFPGAVNICIESTPSCVLAANSNDIIEPEVCGTSVNNTCATGTPIACGQSYKGTITASNGSRNPDYYTFSVTQSTTANISLESEFRGMVILYNAANCASPVFISGYYANGCTPVIITEPLAPGNYAIQVATEDFYGFACSQSNINYRLSLNLGTAPATPTITASGPTTFCTGGSVTLSTTATGIYQWYDNGVAISGANASSYTATAAGTFTVSVADVNGCASAASNAIVVTISNPATPTVSAGGPTTFCTGGSVALTATGTGSTFQWYEGTTAITGATSATYTATTSGSYSVEEVVSGCTSSPSTATVVTVNPLDDASFSYASSTVCSGAANITPTVTLAGGTFTASPAGLVFADAMTGDIDVAASSNGTYTVTYTTAGTCPDTHTETITITAAPDAAFSYANTTYCTSGTNPTPVFTTGSAGTFTSTTGLAVNATTGVIDLANSTAGTYTVTNTIAASGSCPAATATFTVTITAAPNASFTYASTSYCINGTNPLPVYTSGVAGTFSSTAGLEIDAATGEIDLSLSTAGTYTVTNTIAAAGTCAATSATFNLTITTGPDASFSYANASYCSNATNPSPVFSTGVSGTFTGTTGLVINSSTGVIDLAASTAGVYTVTNSVAAGGGCSAATATTSVEVIEAPTATITGGGSLCGGSTATVTVTLTGAGPWDITISDGTSTSSTTGIATTPYTFAATTAGTYTVTTVTDGTCSNVGTGSAVVANGNGYTSTNNQTICPGGSYTINGNTYTLAGTYNDVLVATDGCDSTVITNLSITNINTGITKTDNTLKSDQAGATYQWIDCATNTDIAGATSQSYTATVNGSYKVRVTVANCTEETFCASVNGIGVNEAFIANVSVFPNPTFDYITINAGEYIIERVSIVNIEGRVLSDFNINETNTTVDLSNYSNGMYFLHIYSTDNMTIKKLIKK